MGSPANALEEPLCLEPGLDSSHLESSGPDPSTAKRRSGRSPTLIRMPPGASGSRATAGAFADHEPLTVPSVPSLQKVPLIRDPATHPTRSGGPWKTSPTSPSRVSTAFAATADGAGEEEEGGVSMTIRPLNSAEACSSGQSMDPSTTVPAVSASSARGAATAGTEEEQKEDGLAPAERRKRRVNTCVLGRIHTPSTPAIAFLVKVPVISITPSPSLPHPKPLPAAWYRRACRPMGNRSDKTMTGAK